MIRLYPVLFALLILPGCTPEKTSTETDTSPYVVMVSFDGFRHDYAVRFNATNFLEMARVGASTPSLLSAYPSKTFPNHYSLVTGRYPGNHGIVDNNFYHPELDLVYQLGDREAVQNAAFYEGLPLWQLAQQHGMKSASYFWVGSEAPVGGSFPDYYHLYDGSVPNEKRIDAVIDWLNLEASRRPKFITLYFSFVDSQGHRTGPDADETRAAVQDADKLLGELRERLTKLDLPINLIVTSDHGMRKLTRDRNTLIELDKITPPQPELFDKIQSGTQAMYYFKDTAAIAGVYNLLIAADERFDVYHKAELPEQWKYQHAAVGNLIVVAKPGFYLIRELDEEPDGSVFGTHGYDPYVDPDMGGIFLAEGPHIQPGFVAPSFENIHVYPFVASLLGIPVPTDIDGDPAVLQGGLRVTSPE